MDTLDLALKYAERGLQAFPCLPKDKKPMVRWADMATTETNMLLGWWEHEPTANIGIACGARSGIIVLDVDTDHAGYESLRELQDRYGKLPETWVSETGTGGEHIFFKHPGIEIRNSAGKLGQGLDIRGDGGYVVAPPSIHPNGKAYKWVVLPSQTPLAEMPEWMIELLQDKNIIIEPQSGTGDIIAGERNMALTKIAGAMRRKGLSEDAIFQALTIHNREKCSPPLPDGEVLQIARSMTRYPPQDEYKPVAVTPPAYDVIEQLEADILERQSNPRAVWGLHYAWEFLSVITGGKQLGELIILAGEPGVGKSWWAHQDALYSAIGMNGIPSEPNLIWCGEMKRMQVYRRFFDMLGVPKRRMLDGSMTHEHWQAWNEAKALLMNSPMYVSDVSLDLKGIRPLLEREKGEHGIKHVVFDYDWLIAAPGKDEIATSQNISRELKVIAHDLNLSILLVSSVNKRGMDTTAENLSNVSGSGKKLHDADIVYLLTAFNKDKNKDLSILPSDYDRTATLHIKKGRELDYHLPNGIINYMRETPKPTFREIRDTQKLPDWMTRKDLE